MTMPINLALVRHGESEGNYANRLSRKGDDSCFTDEFMQRHGSQWRLTDRGRGQPTFASAWIKGNVTARFDRYVVSDYIRARETAGLLGFKDAQWEINPFLGERDWGYLDVKPHSAAHSQFGDTLERRDYNRFLWNPPNGESMRNLIVRLSKPLATLHRECSDGNAIFVCHGEVMWGYRVLIERITHSDFEKMDLSKNPFNKIHNCQVIHYTRRDPFTGALTARYNWMRSVCPENLELSSNEWQPIIRKKYSNKDLLESVEKVSQIVNFAA